MFRNSASKVVPKLPLPKVGYKLAPAAVLLGIHRNTARLWMLQIRALALRMNPPE